MLVRKYLILFLIAIISFSCQSSKKEVIDKEKLKVELSQHADNFMIGLKSVLLANMKEGGPLKAVNVCSDTATQLTDFYSETMGITVKRISFKNRNVNNTPDAFEEKALMIFNNLHKEDKLNKNSSLFELSENGVAKLVKPILIGAPCLTCHGDEAQISEEVAKVIMEKYPEDKATGYKVGDLRGAISVTAKL